MKRGLVSVIGALTTPILVFSIYLALSRWPNRIFSAASDYVFFGISIVTGLICGWFLPVRHEIRIPILIAYAIILAYSLPYYGLVFVCVVFGDCL